MAKEKEKTYTFDMVWKMFAESDKRADKRSAELKKQMAETEKFIKELSAEADKRNAETNKQFQAMQKEIGGIGESNGAMTEEMIYNVLEKDKTFAGIKFDYIRKNVPIQTEDLRTLTELDILMVNGNTISIIEAKYKVEKKDVTELVKNKLSDFRQCYPKYSDYKILLGVGGMSFTNKALEVAKKQGIGIIKVVGDKVEYNTNNITIY
jgi:hypothetical protein